MEIKNQALALGKYNRSSHAVEFPGLESINNGFLGSVGRIIESRAPPDKQSCTRNADLG
jgi:hypothetical protein